MASIVIKCEMHIKQKYALLNETVRSHTFTMLALILDINEIAEVCIQFMFKLSTISQTKLSRYNIYTYMQTLYSGFKLYFF